MRLASIAAPAALAIATCLSGQAIAAPTLIRTLPNKMTLVVRENRTRPIVSIEAWVAAGGRDETAANRGVSAVVSRVVFEATTTRPPGEIDKELNEYGASYSSEPGYSFTLYQLSLPARSFSAGLDVLSDMLLHPRFDAKDLDQGIAKARTDSRAAMLTADRASISQARETLHAGTPLARPAAVSEDQLSKLTMAQVKGFYDAYYVASNLMIVVVGDVDPEDVARKVEASFQGMAAGKARPRAKFTEKPFAGPKAVAVASPAETRGCAVTAAFRGPAWGTADALALDVLMAALIESPVSRVQRQLDSGTAEFHQAVCQRGFEPDGGTLTISLVTDPARARDAESALLAELQRMRSTPFDQEELDAAVQAVVKRDAFSMAELWGIGRATGLACLQGRPGADEVYFQRLRAIRPEDLAGVAQKYLDPKQMVLIEMMPQFEADTLGIWKDFSDRVHEKIGIGSAANRQSPKPSASTEAARRTRIDAPLSQIPAAPFQAGRARVERKLAGAGLRVLVSEDPSAPLVTIGVYFAGGVRYENDNNNGITTLLREVLLTSEDPKANGKSYRQSLPGLGSAVPYQDRDTWGISISVPSDSWREALARTAAMFTHPQMDTITVDATRVGCLATLDRWLSDDEVQRARLIFPTKYQVSGYRLPGLGTRRNILGIPPAEIQAWYRKFVVRGNAVVAVFGDVRPAEVTPAVEEAFRDLSAAPFAPSTIAKEGAFEGFREKWELGQGALTTVTVAFDGPPASSPDVPVMYVINSLFSGPRGWYPKHVDGEFYIRSTASAVAQAVDECPIFATIGIDGPLQEENGVNLLFRQFKKAAMLPLTGELAPELLGAKRHAISTYLMALSSNTSRAFQWSRAEVFGLGIDYPTVFPAKIDAVASPDLLRVGMKFFELNEFQKRPYAVAETRPGGW